MAHQELQDRELPGSQIHMLTSAAHNMTDGIQVQVADREYLEPVHRRLTRAFHAVIFDRRHPYDAAHLK